METRTFYRIEGTECVPHVFDFYPAGSKTNYGATVLRDFLTNGVTTMDGDPSAILEVTSKRGFAETPEGAWELAIDAAKSQLERLFEESEQAKSRYLELVDASVDHAVARGEVKL